MGSRRQVLAGSLVATGGLAASTLIPSRVAFGQAELEGRALAERFAAALSAHDLPAFADLFADDYVNHQTSAAAPAPSGKTAKEATVAFFGARLSGIPDLSVAIEALVAAENRVAASFVYSGTHRGTYLGVPPTGRPLRFTSCDIFAVRAGRIAEHWGMGDIAGILAQLKG